MRKCKVCGNKYEPTRQIQTTCNNFECMVAYAEKAAKKAADKRNSEARKKAAADRKETREKLKKYVKKSTLEQEARRAIQAFRREEDLANGYGCISCGKKRDGRFIPLYGHDYDGGHFIPVGRNKSLSLEPTNIHAQCVYCNRDLKGNYGEYRKGLIARYSLEYVEKLESDHAPRHYTRDELVAKKQHYAEKLRELKKVLASRESLD